MPLNGTLKDLSLPNLIQLQCSEQHPARVRLMRNGREGVLLFSDGDLVYAQVGVLRGNAAVYDLLAWEDGEFQVTNGVTTLPQRNIITPWSTLLVEGMRQLDEARVAQNATFRTTPVSGTSPPCSDSVMPRWETETPWGAGGPARTQIGDRTGEYLKADDKPTMMLRNILIGMALLLLLCLFSAVVLVIGSEKRRLEEQVGNLATQVALLQVPSATPSSVFVAANPTFVLTPVIPPSPTATPTPSIPATGVPITATPPPTVEPTATLWQFNGYVFQWNGTRQNSTQGIGDMSVVLVENCVATLPLAQTTTRQDGHFTIEYDPSTRLTPATKFCVKVLSSPPWNSPKPAQPAANWKENSPGAVESIAPLNSREKAKGQNIFYFAIKRTFTGRVSDEQYVGVPGARVILRFLQGNAWIDIMTAVTKSDGVFTLIHETSMPKGGDYQIQAASPSNYEQSNKPPEIAVPAMWQLKPGGNQAGQVVESTQAVDGTDLQVVTFYQRLKVFEYRPTQPMNLYTDAIGSAVKATLAPNSSFRYRILNRGDKRTLILIHVTTDQFIPAKTGLVTPDKPADIRNATFGEAKMPIYIVAADRDHPGWGWIDGYIDN